jgi:hypothetical protein
VTPAAQRRTARRPALRPTPATLVAVNGLPTRAYALSNDIDKLFSCDHRTETGVAHNIAAPTKTAPSVLILFTGFSLVAEPAYEIAWVTHLIQIKRSICSTYRCKAAVAG